MMDILVFFLTGFGALFSILRIILGPSVADRAAALDTMNVIITGLIVFLAHVFESSLYLDIAIIYGVLAFLETVVFSRYLEVDPK
ncbi:MAG: multicomponent Na+:H+ antiporter subunit [Thermotogaceae bacterium]|jgi:multicomponent Na+:H+ antiporter subunit F|nr:multicomponent Na+:H+ antiporter subunit [Thermotogaceae bacterium]